VPPYETCPTQDEHSKCRGTVATIKLIRLRHEATTGNDPGLTGAKMRCATPPNR
jgi:hypothetical protein